MPTPIALPGALHMHTIYSDGSGTVPDLIAAAQAAGLGWIIITDHDTLDAAPFAGWHDDLLVIVGHEITPDRNHFLALGLDQVVPNTLPPQEFVNAVYAAGGFGIIAHPDEVVQNPVKEIYRWDDWSVDGPDPRGDQAVGIELWNLMSDWAEHYNSRLRIAQVFFPRMALTGPTPATLAWWDRLNMQGKRTFGVGGVDVHAFKHRVPWGQIEVFPYRWAFGTLTNYLWLDAPLDRDAAVATQQVYAALKAGSLYFANRLDGAASAILAEFRRGDERYRSGAQVSLAAGPLTFHADVGADARLRLIGNGKPISDGIRALRHTIAAPGIYRLEAYWGSKPWIYTNPIFVQ